MVLFKKNLCDNIPGGQFGYINQKLSKKYILFGPANQFLGIYLKGNQYAYIFKHLTKWICIRGVLT